MDKYERLMTIFSEILKKSKDYYIANIYYIGYASVIGLHSSKEKYDTSLIQIDEIFSSAKEMADSLLKTWRWQWFYENREVLGCRDYDDICELDYDIPESLQEEYKKTMQNLQDKIRSVLQEEG